MESISLIAFGDEMSKIAGFSDFLRKVKDIFSQPEERTKNRVDEFFSPKSVEAKWRRLPQYARSQSFVDAVNNSPQADDKLKMHVQSLHDLSRGSPVAKITSSAGSGKTYEIRKMDGGALGCQCGDWRYKGSVTPGYECKHIKAYRDGKSRAA